MTEFMEDPMLEQPAKKRKRSGKERQQKKAEAIAAAAAAAEAEQAGIILGDASELASEAITGSTQMEVQEEMEDASAIVHEVNTDEAFEAVGDETIAEPSDGFDLEKVKGRVVSSRPVSREYHL
jgi:hypothetical protein